ncbi:MAG: hypothetical protein IT423_22045 [Pirellulaceae bacterium]|nr:hypothetical protein [Pirellulaceae bacterium]
MATRNALTLAELVVVLFILAALGGLVIPLCSDQINIAAHSVTGSTLSETRDAISQYWHDTKHETLDGVITVADEPNRFDIQWLFFSPVTGTRTIDFEPTSRTGWNGPYLLSATDNTTPGSPGLIDGWNHLLVTQYVNPGDTIKDVRIVSGGPNGVVDIPSGTATAALNAGNTGDDIYVSLLLR